MRTLFGQKPPRRSGYSFCKAAFSPPHQHPRLHSEPRNQRSHPAGPPLPLFSVCSLFLRENEGQGPRVKAHPTSFELTNRGKGLGRKFTHTGNPFCGEFLHDRRLIPRREEAQAEHTQTSLPASFLSLHSVPKPRQPAWRWRDKSCYTHSLQPSTPRTEALPSSSPDLHKAHLSKFLPGD